MEIAINILWLFLFMLNGLLNIYFAIHLYLYHYKTTPYKQGFKDGLEACKPNKKLDKAIKEGKEI